MKFLCEYSKFFESIGYINHSDYEKEMNIFKNKKYGEWDMMTNKVELKDNPFYLLFSKNGFEDGDEVIFFAEKERRGKLEKIKDGDYCIRDINKNRWGISAILMSLDGYIAKKPIGMK